MLEVVRSINEFEVKSIFNTTENRIIDMRGHIQLSSTLNVLYTLCFFCPQTQKKQKIKDEKDNTENSVSRKRNKK